MRLLSKLFRSRKQLAKRPPEHAVIIHFSYGSTNLQHIFALEDQLRSVVSEAGIGEYDGHEVAEDGSDGFYYIYGPDAEALFRVISPLLAAYPSCEERKLRCVSAHGGEAPPREPFNFPLDPAPAMDRSGFL
jgi:hypothetical protein